MNVAHIEIKRTRNNGTQVKKVDTSTMQSMQQNYFQHDIPANIGILNIARFEKERGYHKKERTRMFSVFA